ncbi:MAG: hypothetical protein QOE22_268 [Candidatus Parcubacteria bacterium]|nr:hypothetical protein [Candidatus Parcubacteria bacterium]
MNRRLLTLIAAVILLFGILIGLYLLIFGGSAELVVSDDPFAGTGSGLVDGEGLPDMPSGAGEEVAPRLIRITERPVAEGVVAINRVSTTTEPVETASGTPALAEIVVTDTEVRFIDRASGNIYRYTAHERSLTRISNKTLPGIQRASWLADGSVAYVQLLSGTAGNETVATYVLPDSGEGGFFLEQGLSATRATLAGGLFTLLSGATGSVGSLSQSDGTSQRTVFTSSLSSLVVHPTRGNFFAYTKPSAFLDGYAFQVNAASGAFGRVLGPFRGLSALPNPNGTRLLYTYLDRGSPRLAVYDVAARTATALPIATLTEKCVWAPDGLSAYCAVPTGLQNGLPDLWYQGAATFSDRLWKINMTDRFATLVIDPNTVANISIDAVALQTDPEEDVLLFTDKHSGALWVYDL